jgi:hypothetical protein
VSGEKRESQSSDFAMPTEDRIEATRRVLQWLDDQALEIEPGLRQQFKRRRPRLLAGKPSAMSSSGAIAIVIIVAALSLIAAAQLVDALVDFDAVLGGKVTRSEIARSERGDK